MMHRDLYYSRALKRAIQDQSHEFRSEYHLENFRKSILDFVKGKKYPHFFQNIKYLPNCSGIYFLCDENCDIIYVGKSVNLKHRWASHHLKGDFEQRNWYLMVKYNVSFGFDSLEQEEAFYILLFKPRFNNRIKINF